LKKNAKGSDEEDDEPVRLKVGKKEKSGKQKTKEGTKKK